MLDINSLPQVSETQVALMNQKAEKMMAKRNAERAQQDVDGIERRAPMMERAAMVENTPVYEAPMVENESYDEPEVVENSIVEEDDLDQPVKEETKREYNTRMLREAKEAAERERDEWRRQAMAQSAHRYPEVEQKQKHEEEDYFKGTDLHEDSLVEGRHYKEMARRARETEKRLQNIERQYHEEIKNIKVKSSMPDFEQVCSNENFAELRKMNPVLAQTIYNMPDGYEKQELAYTMVKQLGIVKNTAAAKKTNDREVILNNAAKPRPVASINPQQHDSAMGKANSFGSGVTKEMKDRWRREMIEAERMS